MWRYFKAIGTLLNLEGNYPVLHKLCFHSTNYLFILCHCIFILFLMLLKTEKPLHKCYNINYLQPTYHEQKKQEKKTRENELIFLPFFFLYGDKFAKECMCCMYVQTIPWKNHSLIKNTEEILNKTNIFL